MLQPPFKIIYYSLLVLLVCNWQDKMFFWQEKATPIQWQAVQQVLK
jgi:hypothetical protein